MVATSTALDHELLSIQTSALRTFFTLFTHGPQAFQGNTVAEDQELATCGVPSERKTRSAGGTKDLNKARSDPFLKQQCSKTVVWHTRKVGMRSS